MQIQKLNKLLPRLLLENLFLCQYFPCRSGLSECRILSPNCHTRTQNVVMLISWQMRIYRKVECIPVGCVPAARWPYAGVCFPGGCLVRGGSAPRGGCLVRGVCSRRVSGRGVWSGGVCSWGGSVPGGGLVWGGSGPGGVSAPGGISQHALRQTPPVDRQTPVKILPWPNFVAASN